MIGGPSHGTLSSVSAEALKHRRSSKRKKKKAAHGQSYNSDDELMMTSAAKQQEQQTEYTAANGNGGGIAGGYAGQTGRRGSGAGNVQYGYQLPSGVQSGQLTTFADVVHSVAKGIV